MTINQRIKNLRKDMKLNQKEFGAKIGLGQGAISWMEKDDSTIIDQNIRLICDTFHVNEDVLETARRCPADYQRLCKGASQGHR